MSNNSFDLAIGVSANSMNISSKSFYKAFYEKLFKGKYEKYGFIIEYNIKSAPRFDLQQAKKSLKILKQSEIRSLASSIQNLTEENLSEFFTAASKMLFKIDLDSVDLTLSKKNGWHQLVQFGAEFATAVQIKENKLFFEILDGLAKNVTPSDWTGMVNIKIIPDLINMLNNMLVGIDIPPLEFKGVVLSEPIAVIQSDYIIALANLQNRGVPAPPSVNTKWPASANIFVLASDRIREICANTLIKTFDLSFKKEWMGGVPHIAEVDYSIKGLAENPTLKTSGNDFNFSAKITGSAKAGFTLLIPWHLVYSLYGKPNPTANFSLQISKSNLNIIVNKVNPFVILAAPNPKDWAWLADLILTPILNVLTITIVPILTTLIRNIKISNILTVPSFKINVLDKQLILSPYKLSITRFKGMMEISGDLKITS